MSSGMKTKTIEVKEYSNKELSLFIQAILTGLLLIFGVIMLFAKEIAPVFYTLIALTMFVMAYNNHKIYKKNYMTSIYIILGIFVVISTIMEYII